MREVSKEELQQSASEIDSTAGAEILYFDKKVYYEVSVSSVELVTEVRKRIKFYDTRPEDLEYATENIYMYVDGQRESVSKIKAYTYNLVSGEVEETKLDRSQIFEEELSKRYEKTSFTLPKVKKGSVIDIYYKKRSPYYSNIEEFKFQFNIPAEKITATISTPEEFIFKVIPKGNVLPTSSLETKMDQRLGSVANIYNFSAQDIPALKEELLVDNIENYRGGILFELMSTKDSYGNIKSFSKSWGDVAKSIAYSNDYEDEIKKTNIFEDDIDALIANTDQKQSLELAKKIFKHSKSNLKWNDEKSKYFDKGIRKAYKEKSGNSADINLSLVAMLRYAGFNATPVVISTRDNLKPIFPTLDRLNYVIARLEIDNEEYFLDATDKYSEFNILPIRDYNWNGVMIDTPNKQWKLIDLKEPEPSKLVNMVNATLTGDGDVEGKIRTQKTNHYSYLFRKKYFAQSEEDYIRDKESSLDNLLINEYSVENVDDEGAVTESISYEYENAVEKIGDQLFLKPFMFFIDNENPFKLEKRNFPVDFVYSFSDKYIINFKIPDNYEITSIPEPLKLKLGENSGMYQYVISNSGNFIRLAIDFEMYDHRILPKDYEFLKQFFNEKIKKESEQIVLTKIK
ncbi:MAG: transglutaminase domain-containing protein [Mesonia sp.]|uniref:transglutaminase domain-containing protein n=1 Tax=Mesonia sp. TaxID=1960830 RepID=UPI0032426ECF